MINSLKQNKTNPDQGVSWSLGDSFNLRLLMHYVGDIHQPLHSVALFNHTYPKGDAGGNLLKIKLLNGSFSNFHAFWDAGAYRLQNDSYQFVRPMNLQNTT